MAQEIPPSKGYNVKYELEKFEANPSLFLDALTDLPPNSHEITLVGTPDAESIRSIIKKLREKLNDYACLPEIEYQHLLSDINQMAFALMQRTQETAALSGIDPTQDDDVEAKSKWVHSLTSSSQELERREETWISSAVYIANHSRFGCSRCFNDGCPKRK